MDYILNSFNQREREREKVKPQSVLLDIILKRFLQKVEVNNDDYNVRI